MILPDWINLSSIMTALGYFIFSLGLIKGRREIIEHKITRTRQEILTSILFNLKGEYASLSEHIETRYNHELSKRKTERDLAKGD